METILNTLHPIFTNNKWLPQTSSLPQTSWLPHIKSNTLSYHNTDDEFVITYLPQTAEFEITVPLTTVRYKNKFNNIDTAAEYIKNHLNYYQTSRM